MEFLVRLFGAKDSRVASMFFMGIDTSCYTTSIAIVDENERLIYDGRTLLKVGAKERGLRQSEALFQHSNNLPALCSEALENINPKQLLGIGVSTRPRNMEGSYMPVFTAGHNLAKVVSSCTKVPIIECSHQRGHIIAGAWSINKEYSSPHLVYHISGGTTELLLAYQPSEKVEVIGGTEDLNAGQYIDRIGVALGMSFPCGKEMDKLCSLYDADSFKLPVSVKDTYLSFSGPESHVQRLISKEAAHDEAFAAHIAKAIFLNIADALEKTIINACKAYNVKNVLIVGGVASNSIISKKLQNSRKIRESDIHIDISKPHYSSDNAVGAAVYAKRTYQNFGGLHEQH